MTELNMKRIKQKLKQATVGIAGLGGLGSVVANCLVRTGIENLILVDFDIIDETNLNRQLYFLDQLGQRKVQATIENLSRINPEIKIKAHKTKLNTENTVKLFQQAHIIAECLDMADEKQMLVETVLAKMPNKIIVSVSGLAGYGDSNSIQTKRISERLILVGDNKSGIDTNNILTAGRVGIAACHQANAIIEIVLDELTV
ncbi:MAG: sulfur carrier protein ThiS adenylyltransferase ThiF [Planctomycetota bacterium]|jgi:sulfur carrier protein ThiS adenylyltransferase